MTRRYRRHPELRLTALEGEGVALHLGTRRYYTVSESGLDLLEALERPRSLEELVAVLTSKYQVTVAVAADTTRAFLDRGVQAGVLLVEERP
ncbi:MAG TPA: PqqD family protein [Gemmatimonadales bacterium]|nr:PqqD family protein [Gemmatimonadales bacterium]